MTWIHEDCLFFPWQNEIVAITMIYAATSHYLNQCFLVYWRIYASLGLNELSILQIWALDTQHIYGLDSNRPHVHFKLHYLQIRRPPTLGQLFRRNLDVRLNLTGSFDEWPDWDSWGGCGRSITMAHWVLVGEEDISLHVASSSNYFGWNYEFTDRASLVAACCITLVELYDDHHIISRTK